MKSRRSVLTAMLTVAALGAAAPAALAAPAAHPAHPAPAVFANPGAAEPSLSASLSPSARPVVAYVGPGGSLWVASDKAGTWHRTRLAGPGSADSAPSLVVVPTGLKAIAVEGADHSLWFYAYLSGHWHHVRVSGHGTAYSAPSLYIGADGAGIAVEGPHHSLYFDSVTSLETFSSEEVDTNVAYSAPSLVIRDSSQADTDDPAGEVDIAVQNARHSLSLFYNPGSGWVNDVIGAPGKNYSAPSLIVFAGLGSAQGTALIAVEGPHHSLRSYIRFGTTDIAGTLKGRGWVYSAPTVSEGDSETLIPIAFQSRNHSLGLVFDKSLGSGTWKSDPVSVLRTAYSAGSIVLSPSGELYIAVQGAGNSLRLSKAAETAPGHAPHFTGKMIAGPGTTFGG
jgi:hypothetical protein